MTNNRSGRLKITTIEWAWAAAAVLVLAAAVITSWRMQLGDRIGLLSLATSMVGLIVALMIFRNQKRDAAASEERVIAAIERRAIQEASSDRNTSETDFYAAETLILNALGDPVGDTVLRLEKDNVPLKLVRDVVIGWERAKVQGEWTVGTLLSAIRRRGRGNHAWWLTFRDPSSGRERVFRVSRGGPGNGPDDILVTER